MFFLIIFAVVAESKSVSLKLINIGISIYDLWCFKCNWVTGLVDGEFMECHNLNC